jgi:hypothetical protein
MDGLIVAPCSHAAALHAVMRWHYSQAMPAVKLAAFGAWELGEFVGVVIFGRGSSPFLLKQYDLDATEGCELVRVALKRGHRSPTTAVVAEALKALKRTNPGLRLVVSFADPIQGHLGKIYQAGNWIFTGKSNPTIEHFWKDRWIHTRSRGTLVGRIPESQLNAMPRRTRPGKYRYLMPLDRQMRRRVMLLAETPPS